MVWNHRSPSWPLGWELLQLGHPSEPRGHCHLYITTPLPQPSRHHYGYPQLTSQSSLLALLLGFWPPAAPRLPHFSFTFRARTTDVQAAFILLSPWSKQRTCQILAPGACSAIKPSCLKALKLLVSLNSCPFCFWALMWWCSSHLRWPARSHRRAVPSLVAWARPASSATCGELFSLWLF